MNVLLADDSGSVRWALRTFVQVQMGWTVVGEAAHSEVLLAMALALRPDMILVEWDLPGRPVGEIIGALHRQLGTCKIIVLNQQPECREAAFRAGADAFICKIGPPQQVLSVLCDLGGRSARSPRRNGLGPIYQTQS